MIRIADLMGNRLVSAETRSIHVLPMPKKDVMKETLGWTLEIVCRPPKSKRFVLLPRRWVVERTFAWMGRTRRVSKASRSGEVLPETEEAFLYVTMVRLMIRRLTSPV
ncbi:MAG: transposase [Candidatus Poribacteria bacterium]|nr:transposase [Candidatus Poribacteria bacterium]